MFLLNKIRDFLFPPYCVVCGRRLLAGEEVVCMHCNMGLPRTFLWNEASVNNLEKRFWGKVEIEKACAYIYHYPREDSAKIVYDIKYNHRPDIARAVGFMMAQEIGLSGFFDDIEVIIPVPLAKGRQRQRGYNQSEELARGIARKYPVPVNTDILKRVEGIASQTYQWAKDRRDHVDGTFYTVPAAQELEGKHCLLVDDIITTGSTLTECAVVLNAIPGIRLSLLSYGCVNWSI